MVNAANFEINFRMEEAFKKICALEITGLSGARNRFEKKILV